MRKYILLLMALCLQTAARGQTYNWHYDYWFDNDYSSLRTGTNGNGSNSFQIEADVSALSEGLHSINIQAVGNGLQFVEVATSGDAPAESTRKPVFERQTQRSAPVSRYFVKMAEQQTARCWYDNDLSTLTTGVATGEPLLLDVGQLKDGFHLINIQAVGQDGSLSQPKAYPFVKIPQVVGVDHLTCLCMIDDQLYRQEQVAASNGVVAWQFDVSSLPQGFHRIYVQVVTPSGAASALYQGFFFRETTTAEFGEMKCVYAIDGSEFDNTAGTLANGTFHFDLDVASLSDGLHRLAYMLSNGKGVTTKVQTQFFTKIPLGGYGTVEYWYWLNDQGYDDIVKVKIPERQNPFQLTGLLPVNPVALRSEQFEFRIEAGTPVIYAKNTFHARFYDASGRFVDMNSDFVDERVHQAVDQTTLLEAVSLNSRALGRRKAPQVSTVKSLAIDRPAANAIAWFKMEAKAGDSLQFRLDLPATVQLFSPSAKEVYSAKGAESVLWGGIHAEETGTYYLAVHDVTARNGSWLNLYYEFIDRYAVLRQDVTTVGNGGPSTVTFQGNGFGELTKVDLVMGGTTLHAVAIGRESNATTSVKFDFGGAPLGDYDAVFHFGDEEVLVEQCITVEQAVPVFIDGHVSYAPQFLVALGNRYDFRLTNHGNQTAYDQLLRLRIFTTEVSNIVQVLVDGIELLEGTVGTSLELEGLPTVIAYDLMRSLRPGTTESYLITVKTAGTDPIFVSLNDIGGGSTPVASLDPNDIYGYLDEKGSKYIREGLTDVYYTIEFENDPEAATAAAHDIYVADELDKTLFDLATFMPTRVKIGSKETALSPDDTYDGDDGHKHTVVTLDMRPEINAVAEVKCDFNPATGVAQWHIGSLDPMTMEPTTEPMDGVLPVNTDDGNGIGQLSFDIALRPGLARGTEVPNKALLTFDTNEPIETPTWVNIIGTVDVGDVNGDGKVDMADLRAVVSHILGNTPDGFNAMAADVNTDGKVDIADVTRIIDLVLNPKGE